MSKAENLLNNMTDEEIATYLADSRIEPHIIISDDRIISVPKELKRLGVQNDHNIETVTFDCPRYWDGHDMSNMAVYVNYMRSDGYDDSYPVEQVHIDETDESIMHFDWTISKNVTAASGEIAFIVCIRATDNVGDETNAWHSELNRECYISKGMNISDVHPIEIESDTLTQILMQTQHIDQKVENSVNAIAPALIAEMIGEGAGGVETISHVDIDSLYEVEHVGKIYKVYRGETLEASTAFDLLFVTSADNAECTTIQTMIESSNVGIYGRMKFRTMNGLTKAWNHWVYYATKDELKNDTVEKSVFGTYVSIYDASTIEHVITISCEPASVVSEIEVTIEHPGGTETYFLTPKHPYVDVKCPGPEFDVYNSAGIELRVAYIQAIAKYVDEQIGDIETSLENIMTKYGIGAEVQAALNDVITNQNEILGVSE